MLGRLAFRVRRKLGLYSAPAVWDRKFTKGEFDFLRTGRSPHVLDLLKAKHVVVELGCGEGILARHLTCARYIGYDISAVAIAEARKNAPPFAEFYTLDIVKWPGQNADAIVIEEVIYYLTRTAQKNLVRRAADCLNPGGVLIVTIWNGEQHADTIEVCRTALPFRVIERGKGLTLVWHAPGPAPTSEPV